MDLYFSDVFAVAPDLLADYGAFNVSLINDLPLFIDPFLLFNSENANYQALHHGIIEYVRFLRDRAVAGELAPGLLTAWFMFPEVKQTWFGYSQSGNSGRGLGPDFARALSRNLYTIFTNFGAEAITRSSHLEKLCLIKDGVGRDNISDFTTNLIKEYLLEYTQAFALKHVNAKQRRVVSVSKVRFNYQTRSWETRRYELPFYQRDYVILTPKDILTKEEIWINKSDMVRDFEDIAGGVPNEQLRAQIHDYFIRSLPVDATRKEVNEIAARAFAQFPELLDYYIRFKEDTGDVASSLSKERVREVESVFVHNVTELVASLGNEVRFYARGGGTYDEARARVLFLKDIIENKGGHRIFYIDGKPLRREADLQILFRLTWFATTTDISREVNDGRGPVDFKASRGRFDKSLVEFKLASNTQLRRNLEKQVPIYEKASDAHQSLKVIAYFTDGELTTVEKILTDLGLHSCRDIVLIDARASNKPSGSKA